MRYNFLVPSTALADPTDLAAAYDVFQRLALAVEVVRLDMNYHGDAKMRTSFMWRKVDLHFTRILKVLYLTQSGRGSVLTQDVLPPYFWCVPHSVSRRLRDFLVLRHILKAAAFFSK